MQAGLSVLVLTRNKIDSIPFTYQPINQSTNQPTLQSTNQLTLQSTNQLISPSTN